MDGLLFKVYSIKQHSALSTVSLEFAACKEGILLRVDNHVDRVDGQKVVDILELLSSLLTTDETQHSSRFKPGKVSRYMFYVYRRITRPAIRE